VKRALIHLVGFLESDWSKTCHQLAIKTRRFAAVLDPRQLRKGQVNKGF
jgi:hypothetical protein